MNENWFEKGLAAAQARRWEDALHCYDQAIEENQSHEKAWFKKGVVLEKLKRYQDALQCFERAVEIYPRYAEAWFNRGSMLVNGFKRYREAMAFFEEAKKLGDPDADKAIAVCLRKLQVEREDGSKPDSPDDANVPTSKSVRRETEHSGVVAKGQGSPAQPGEVAERCEAQIAPSKSKKLLSQQNLAGPIRKVRISAAMDEAARDKVLQEQRIPCRMEAFPICDISPAGKWLVSLPDDQDWWRLRAEGGKLLAVSSTIFGVAATQAFIAQLRISVKAPASEVVTGGEGSNWYRPDVQNTRHTFESGCREYRECLQDADLVLYYPDLPCVLVHKASPDPQLGVFWDKFFLCMRTAHDACVISNVGFKRSDDEIRFRKWVQGVS